MTTGAVLDIVTAGFNPRQGLTSSSSSEKFQPMAGSRRGGAAQETTPNSVSSWRAVLASAGIFAENIDGEKTTSNLPYENNAPENTSSIKGSSALTTGSLEPQPLTGARSNSAAMRAVNLTQARVPDLALPSDAETPESGAVPQDQKMQAKSDAGNAGQAARALHSDKNEKSKSARAPETEAILNPAAAAIPAIVSASVMSQPATVSEHVQFVSSSSVELASTRAALSASPHASVPETRNLQSAVNGIGESKTPDQMMNEQQQSTEPFRSAHFIDAAADLALPQDQPSSTSLKSAAALQQGSSSSYDSVTRPQSFDQVDAIASVPNGEEVQLNAAPAAPKSAESHEIFAAGSVARQASPVAGRSSAITEAATSTAHPANHADSSLLEQSLLPVRDIAGFQMAPGASGNGSSARASTSTGTAASDIQQTFFSLDGANHVPAPTWIHAGAHTAEAGYQDPALGWVGVRAQVDVYGVHAALVPGSADAAQALGGHLVGLNAHLAEHHAGVETLTMAAPEIRSNEHDLNQRSGRNSGQGSSMGEHSGQSGDSNRGREPDTRAARPMVAIASERTVIGSPPGGVYVSVMA